MKRDDAYSLFNMEKVTELANLLWNEALANNPVPQDDADPETKAREQRANNPVFNDPNNRLTTALDLKKFVDYIIKNRAKIDSYLELTHKIIGKLVSDDAPFADKIRFLSSEIFLPLQKKLFELSYNHFSDFGYAAIPHWLSHFDLQIREIGLFLNMVLNNWAKATHLSAVNREHLQKFVQTEQACLLLQLQYINTITRIALIRTENIIYSADRYRTTPRRELALHLFVVMCKSLTMPIFNPEYIDRDEIDAVVQKLRRISQSTISYSNRPHVDFSKEEDGLPYFSIESLTSYGFLPADSNDFDEQPDSNKFIMQMLLEIAIAKLDYPSLCRTMEIMSFTALRKWLSTPNKIHLLAQVNKEANHNIRCFLPNFVERFLICAMVLHEQDCGLLHRLIRENSFSQFSQIASYFSDTDLQRLLLLPDENGVSVIVALLEKCFIDNPKNDEQPQAIEEENDSISSLDTLLNSLETTSDKNNFSLRNQYLETNYFSRLQNPPAIEASIESLQSRDKDNRTIFDKFIAKDDYDRIYWLLQRYPAEYHKKLLRTKLENNESLFAHLQRINKPRLMEFIGYHKDILYAEIIFNDLGSLDGESTNNSIEIFFIKLLKQIDVKKASRLDHECANSIIYNMADFHILNFCLQLKPLATDILIESAQREAVLYLLNNLENNTTFTALALGSIPERYREQLLLTIIKRVGYDVVLPILDDAFSNQVLSIKIRLIIKGLVNDIILYTNAELRTFVINNTSAFCAELIKMCDQNLDVLQKYNTTLKPWLQNIVGENNKNIQNITQILEVNAALLPLRGEIDDNSLLRLIGFISSLKLRQSNSVKQLFSDNNNSAWEQAISKIIVFISGVVLNEHKSYRYYQKVKELLFTKQRLFANTLLALCETYEYVCAACYNRNRLLYALVQDIPDSKVKKRIAELGARHACHNKPLSYEVILALDNYFDQHKTEEDAQPQAIEWLRIIATNIQNKNLTGEVAREFVTAMQTILQRISAEPQLTDPLVQIVYFLLNTTNFRTRSSFLSVPPEQVDLQPLQNLLPVVNEMLAVREHCNLSKDTQRQSGYSIEAIRNLIVNRDNIIAHFLQQNHADGLAHLYDLVVRDREVNGEMQPFSIIPLHLEYHRDVDQLNHSLDHIVRTVVNIYLSQQRDGKVEEFYQHFDRGYCMDGRFTSLLNWAENKLTKMNLNNKEFVALMQTFTEEANHLAVAMGQKEGQLRFNVDYIEAHYLDINCETDANTAIYAPEGKVTAEGVRAYLSEVLGYDDENEEELQDEEELQMEEEVVARP